jgi:hypothetical protein
MKRDRVLVGLFLLLLAVAAALQPVRAAPAPMAYTGVTGTVVDVYGTEPWRFGAEVIAFQIVPGTGVRALGSAVLDQNGFFSISHGSTDPLGLCPAWNPDLNCASPANDVTVYVLIDFNCELQTANGTRPDYETSDDLNCPTEIGDDQLVGLPTDLSLSYITDETHTGNYDFGPVRINTGPLAITLHSIRVAGVAGMPLALVLAVILMGAGTWAVARRQRLSG